MPSDKCNLIMTIYSSRLDFFTVQCRFSWRCAFLPTAAAPMLALWFNQNLPVFSFVLHSFFHYCIILWLHYKTRVSEALAEVLPTECYPKSLLKLLETKIVVIHWHTHIQLMTGAHALMIKHSAFSILAGLMVEMLFMLFPIRSVISWKWSLYDS